MESIKKPLSDAGLGLALAMDADRRADERSAVETGWLLDDGILCIGAGCDHGLGLVTYTDPNAIRFARQQDADAFVRVLRGIGFNALAANVKPVDHSWG